jgi:hypothetical protein
LDETAPPLGHLTHSQEPDQRHHRSSIDHPERRRPALQLLAETAQPAQMVEGAK